MKFNILFLNLNKKIKVINYTAIINFKFIKLFLLIITFINIQSIKKSLLVKKIKLIIASYFIFDIFIFI